MLNEVAGLSRSPGAPDRDITEARFLIAPPVFSGILEMILTTPRSRREKHKGIEI